MAARQRPLAAAAAGLTLALGVAAVTVALAVERAALAPLGYPREERLVRVYGSQRDLRGSPNPRLAAKWDQLQLGYLDAADYRVASRTLAGIGLWDGYRAVLETGMGGEPRSVEAARIDGELLGVLGVAPARGRVWDRREVAGARGERLVLLSHELWADALGGDPAAVGRTLRLDGRTVTIAGVMPRGFTLPGRHDRLWTPLVPAPAELLARDAGGGYDAVARLAHGADLASARRELAALAGRLAAAHPDTNAGEGVALVPLADSVLGGSRPLVALLGAAAVAVLLVAGVNLLHLILTQAIERRGERAVRVALGARRLHLVRQAAREMLPAAAGGAAGGLLLAALALRVLPALLAAELPRLAGGAGLDAAAVTLAVATAGAAMLASATAPLLLGEGALAGAGAGRAVAATAGRRVGAVQEGLVIAEVALTLMLTAGALGLARGWMRMAAVDPGFAPRNVLVQQVSLPEWRYPDEPRRGEMSARLLARLAALPGAPEVALASRLPLPGLAEVGGFRIVGRDAPRRAWVQGRSAVLERVSAGFLRVLRIPLLAGEPPGAGTSSACRMWVNRTLADRHWPGGSPVGAAVILLGSRRCRVAGVFGDIRTRGPGEGPGELILLPWEMGPPADFAVLVRGGRRPLDLAAEVRRALRELDPELPLPAAARLDDLVTGSLFGPRSRALLFGLSAGVALALALVGTYGVMAYRIGRRGREIAIRMSAGAAPARILWWVLRRALALALAGVAAGAGLALAAGRLLAGMLFGAAAAEPRALAGAALLLVLGCLAAAWGPARRASRVDPAAMLRSA